MHEINANLDCRRNAPSACQRLSFEKYECGASPMQYRSQYDLEPWRHENGSINVVDYDTNLLPPQRRTFLFPAMYNSGCETLYCNNTAQCPNTSRATTSPATRQMFDVMFGSYDPYGQVNGTSTACSGVKCNSPNGTNGWRYGADGRPMWMSN